VNGPRSQVIAPRDVVMADGKSFAIKHPAILCIRVV
jgi:hypothetical protein